MSSEWRITSTLSRLRAPLCFPQSDSDGPHGRHDFTELYDGISLALDDDHVEVSAVRESEHEF